MKEMVKQIHKAPLISARSKLVQKKGFKIKMKLEEPISYIYSSNSDITALELRRKRKEKQMKVWDLTEKEEGKRRD